MAELAVAGFDNPNDANLDLTELTRLEKEYLIDLEDSVVMIRGLDGIFRIKQSVNLMGVEVVSGGLFGATWGTLIGLLFLNPLAGLVLGGVIGAGSSVLSGSMIGYGINDDFIKSLGGTLRPDTSALLLLIRKLQPEKLLAELPAFKGRILRTSLPPEQEAKLQEAMRRVHTKMSPTMANSVPALSIVKASEA
jgi:uncharacterized membrane protein